MQHSDEILYNVLQEYGIEDYFSKT